MPEPTATVRSLAIGSAMIDIVAIIADRDIERVTLHNATVSFLLVEQGRKIEAESISTHIGGGAINVAVALKRLGHGVEVLIKVGDDLEARQVWQHLSARAIGTDLVTTSTSLPTGSAVLISSHDRDAAIYTQRGANTALTPTEIMGVDFSRYGLVYISPLSGASADCFTPAVQRAADAGAFTAVNPGIRQITTRSPDILDALGHIDLLVINAKEAAALAPALMAYTGKCPATQRALGAEQAASASLWEGGLRLTEGTFPLAWFFEAMASCGARRVAVTNGVGGSYLAGGGDVFHCPVHPVAVKGTAGAGDAFCATLAHGLAAGVPARQALAQAAVNAASVTRFTDTQSGLLDLVTLDVEMRSAGLSVTRLAA